MLTIIIIDDKRSWCAMIVVLRGCSHAFKDAKPLAILRSEIFTSHPYACSVWRALGATSETVATFSGSSNAGISFTLTFASSRRYYSSSTRLNRCRRHQVLRSRDLIPHLSVATETIYTGTCIIVFIRTMTIIITFPPLKRGFVST